MRQSARMERTKEDLVKIWKILNNLVYQQISKKSIHKETIWKYCKTCLIAIANIYISLYHVLGSVFSALHNNSLSPSNTITTIMISIEPVRKSNHQFISVQSLSRVRLSATPWIAARQASLSITNSQSSLKLTSIESVMPSSHLILCHPLLLLPPPLSASESFPMSQLFAWGGQSPGVSASASFPPKNTKGWPPSEWTGWISLQSKGLSRVFSNTTVQKHQFFGAQLSSQSNFHIHTRPLEKP